MGDPPNNETNGKIFLKVKHRPVSFLRAVLLTIAAVYFLGFAFFVSSAYKLPVYKSEDIEKDATLVLFTGLPERIYALRELMGSARGGLVFISGVHPQVLLGDLLPDGAGRARVVMDYDAASTRENAENTARFLDENAVDTPFYLITNTYHMPRSLLLLKGEGVGAQAIPYPVSGGFKPLRWWREYHKWIWVSVDFHSHFPEFVGKFGLNRAS